jgi:hypothetical protein
VNSKDRKNVTACRMTELPFVFCLCQNSLSLLHQLLHRLPASATPVQIAFATLSLAANDIRTRSNVIDDDVEASLKLIQELIDESTKKLREDREWKNKMKGDDVRRQSTSQ